MAATKNTPTRFNDTWFTHEAVAQRMYDLGCGLWHAAHTMLVERIEAGLEGYGTCRLCGGRTAPNQNNEHPLCVARERVGSEIRPLDSTPRCSCSPCAKKDGLDR